MAERKLDITVPIKEEYELFVPQAIGRNLYKLNTLGYKKRKDEVAIHYTLSPQSKNITMSIEEFNQAEKIFDEQPDHDVISYIINGEYMLPLRKFENKWYVVYQRAHSGEHTYIECDYKGFKGGAPLRKYKGRMYKVRTGVRGGQYILVKGKKVYA
jgi:hypothetical protein